MKRIFIVAFVLLGFVSTATAGVPDSSNSYVEPWDTYGQAFVCPGAGHDTMLVWVRDSGGAWCPGVRVEIDLSDCSNLCMDCPNGLSAVTDSMGFAIMNPRVGGCDSCAVIVRAGGIVIRTYSAIRSADWDGSTANGIVDMTDFAYFVNHYPPQPPTECVDYNGDSVIDESDQDIFNACYSNSNTYPCMSSACELSPPCLDFGVTTVGTWKDKTFKLTNNSGGTISDTISATCDHYSIESGGGPYTLNDGEFLEVTVRFAPGSSGTHTCTIETGAAICDDFFCTGIGEDPPACQVAPTSLDFDTVAVGNTKNMTFTITNTGGGILSDTVSVISDHYSIISGGGAYLIPGGDSLVVTVQFAPADTGTHVCTIETGDPLCSDVSCTGYGEGVPACEVMPASLDFDTVTVGNTKEMTFTITNTGGGILSDTVSATCDHYSIVSGGGPYSIPGGDSLVVTVQFAPADTGTHYCTIETGHDLCSDVSCTGYGEEPPVCEVVPTVLDFDTVLVGNTKDMAFTIKNTGGGILSDTVSVACDHYSIVSGEGPFSIPGGDSLVVTVQFAPADSGMHGCIIETGDTLCSDVTCAGYGELPPACLVEPDTLDFGTVTVGNTKDTTFTIKNTGGGTLSDTVSATCDHYSIVSGDGPYSIPGGDSLVVTVRFAPADTGMHVCTIETGDDLCSDVSCIGYGEEPPACLVEPDSLNFGIVTVGNTKDLTFTITNNGGGTLSDTISAACDHYSIISGGGPYSIPGGDSLVVTVQFAPTDTGMHVCMVETGDALCSDVPCTGIGGEPAACHVEPDSLDFGMGYLGSYTDMTFTVSNIGGDTLSGNITESCPDFSIVSGGGPYDLTGGDSVIVVVRFEPTVEGSLTCFISTGQALCPDVSLIGIVGPEPFISSITDVANDQGRWVRINLLRSARDAAGSPTPILQYEAYRRIDQLPMVSSSDYESVEEVDPEIRLKRAREAGMLSDAGILLEGWEFAGSIPAHGETEYNMIAPTLADSTIADGMHWSVFFIRAATDEPLTFFDSPIDSGYSLDNLAPAAPQGFSVAYNTGSGNQLSWDPCEDEDFDYFNVYRSTDPDFIPTPDDLVHSTIDVEWLDTVSEGYQYSYKITAVDFSGNESDASSADYTTPADEPPISKVFELYQNIPNPFNPTTEIRFDVPACGGIVKLMIYDVSGRWIKTLVDGPQTPGLKSVTWDSRDARGQRVASGVYFYRMQAPGFEKTHKLVLLK